MDLWKNETRMFKFGGATGSNFSAIRSSDELLSSGGYSFGLMPFLEVGDKAAGAVRASHIPHRSCKRVTIDIDHPDVEHFMRWRMEEEQKAAALYTGAQAMRKHLMAVMEAVQHSESESRFSAASNPRLKRVLRKARAAMVPEVYIQRVLDYARQGYTEIDIPVHGLEETSEIFASLSSYQAQLSVRVPDRFMKALETESQWEVTARKDGAAVKSFAAADMWSELAQSGWAVGAPGVQFSDAIARSNSCPNTGAIAASSPCGEVHFLEDTASVQASVDMLSMVNDEGDVAIESLEHASALTTMMLDISVSMAQYPTRNIAMRTHQTRPVGVGYHNLAAALCAQGIAYASEAGRAMAAGLTALMSGAAYHMSAQLSRDLGAFAAYGENKVAMGEVIAQHHRYVSATRGQWKTVPAQAIDHTALKHERLSDALCRVWDMAQDLGHRYGFRNAQVSAVGESQVMQRLMDAATAGIAPLRHRVHYQMEGQGNIRKTLAPHMLQSLRAMGYSRKAIAAIETSQLGHHTLKDAPHINSESLLEKGLDDVAIERIEQALPHVSHLRHAFDPWVLGDKVCRDVLKLTEEEMRDASFDILSALGFSAAEIQTAHEYICGSDGLDVSLLKREEDARVLALCLNGEDGAATIHPEDELAMIAATQPFVSGAVSHPITLPYDTGIAQHAALLYQGWKSGIKTLSLAREDACLMGAMLRYHTREEELVEVEEDEITEDKPDIKVASSRERIETVATAMAEEFVAKQEDNCRRNLPERRGGYTQKATLGGRKIYLRTGEYRDGELGEIFIDMPQETPPKRALINHFAMAISVALQHGVPLESFVESFMALSSDPQGEVVGNEAISSASSMVDYVFRELAVSYLGREDLADWGGQSRAVESQHMDVTVSGDYDEEPFSEEMAMDVEDDGVHPFDRMMASPLQDNASTLHGEAFSDIDACLREINQLTQSLRDEYELEDE